jgi:hypothetical protein
MFKERESKWTRERSFLEVNGGDIMMLCLALFFLSLTIGATYVVLFQPRIPGLHELFTTPVSGPPADQKLHLAPGETEMRLYPAAPANPETPKK